MQNANLKTSPEIKRRQHWISILSRALPAELEGYWKEIEAQTSFSHLRQPETGLVMTRARAGGRGQRFNLGEATITRCSVTLSSGEIGHSYVCGRNKRHAELAAVFDALLQNQAMGSRLQSDLITKIEARLTSERKAREEKVSATKVDFFTMARGED